MACKEMGSGHSRKAVEGVVPSKEILPGSQTCVATCMMDLL